MTRIMFPFFPLVALAAAFMGILNACGKFFLPAFSSALFNLASIVTGVILAYVLPRFGRQMDHFVVGAAQLEREYRLHILALEQHAIAAACRQDGLKFQRRLVGNVIDARGADFG